MSTLTKLLNEKTKFIIYELNVPLTGTASASSRDATNKDLLLAAIPVLRLIEENWKDSEDFTPSMFIDYLEQLCQK